MSVCEKCHNEIRTGGKTNNKLDCDVCQKSFHRVCAGVSASGSWDCPACHPKNEPEPTLRQIMDAIVSTNGLIQDVERSLQESIKSCEARVAETETKVDNAVLEVQRLTLDNAVLKERLSDCERRIVAAEQYSRVNDIDVHGLPHSPGENIAALLASLGRALGLRIEPEMIDVAHRTGPRTAAKRGLLVRFLRKSDKEQVLAARRTKWDMKVSQLDYYDNLSQAESRQIVYLNESLSPDLRTMLKKARDFKREGKLFDVWVRSGKLYARKVEGGDKLWITDSVHLSMLASSVTP